MPSQKILEWCTTSINSIQQSVQQMVSGYTKPGLQVPPDIMQIQELSGQKPGEKFKSFNAIVNSIVESVKMGVELETNLCEMNPILLNLVKANVGVKLRLSDFIVESLKSEDSTISRKALDAQWFFEGDNPNVTVEFFTRDILPFVSVRTRLNIVKRLARGLQGHEIKAQQFFTELVELYGVEENLRILCDCSESFIFDSILQNKIVVPLKILKILYSKYPNLIVQYLQLGNKNNTGNSDSRKVHEIDIHHYDVFLPELIRQHPQAFVELYELTPEKNLDTLSCHRSTLLLTNVKQQILSRPDIHLKLLQPKIVKLKLTPAEIETMLENYLPKDITDFSLDAALEFLDNYLGSEKIQVLLDKFQKIYNKNLLDHTRKIIGSNAKATRSGLKLFRKLAPAERETQVRILLRNADEELKNVLTCYLNTAESLPYFKDKLSKSTGSADDRAQLIGCMLVSCGVNNSKKDLLSVLQYFQERHANEQKLLLCQFLQYVKNEFDLKSLEETHWSVLRNIVLNVHARKELFASHVGLIESVLEAMLRHAMTRKRRDDRRVEEAIDLIVECKLENFMPSWNVMEDDPALAKECLESFFSLIPVKYPMELHHVWKKKNDRLAVALSLLKSINSFNGQNAKKRPLRKINLRDYPWILKLSEEFISRDETGNRKEVLVKILKQQAPDFYEIKVNESSTIRDIGTGEALHLLKRQPDRILADWEAYLREARDDLQGQDEKRARAARSFVAATRWHHTLPVKFVEACLADHAKSPGSLAVLGILLPGEMFERVATVHAPTTTTTTTRESFEMSRAVVRAAKWTNPPVSLASLRPFCGLGLADGVLASLAMRASPASVAEFADELLPTRQARRGVRVARIVATRRRFREVLARAWSGSRDPATRRQLARAIFKIFVEQQPNSGNWELAASCLRGLTPDEREILQELSDIERVHPTHLSSYVDSYLGKVEELFEASMDFKWRTRCVCLLLESFDERVTSAATDELLAKIVERYFFDAHCAEISRAARTFALRYYLMAAGDGKFEARLSATMSALRRMLDGFDAPHAKRRRFYPANYSLREFFEGLLTEMCFGEGDAEKKLRVVRSVMEAFDANLSPWQEPASYVSLNLYREFLQSTSPEDFGARSAKRIAGMVEDFSSSEFVADVADCLSDLVVTGKIFREQRNALGLKMAVIEGLMRGDEYYGALTAVKMLDAQHAREYDDRYDGFIATLRQMKNSSVQYNLYKHINNLGEQ